LFAFAVLGLVLFSTKPRDWLGKRLWNNYFVTSGTYKNSLGDEIANVNFFYNIAHVDMRPAPTPIERVRNFY